MTTSKEPQRRPPKILFIYEVLYTTLHISIFCLSLFIYVYIYIYSRILYIPWTWTQQHLVFEGLKKPGWIFWCRKNLPKLQDWDAPVSQVANHDQNYVCIYIYHGPPQTYIFSKVFMVNNLVFRWPKLLFFMVLGAHGICIYIYTYVRLEIDYKAKPSYFPLLLDVGIRPQGTYTHYFFYTYLDPQQSLFLKVSPPKHGLFQQKQGSFGFQVYNITSVTSNSFFRHNTPSFHIP